MTILWKLEINIHKTISSKYAGVTKKLICPKVARIIAKKREISYILRYPFRNSLTILSLTHTAKIELEFYALYDNLYSHVRPGTLREKCPNTEFFLVRIFLYSETFHGVGVIQNPKNRIRKFTNQDIFLNYTL